MIRWLSRFTACDVLCFQEVDLENSLADLSQILVAHGFTAVVQDRKTVSVVNATFFKSSRFRLRWTQHRSRAMLLGLCMQDGQEFCIANVHLEAGCSAADEHQRRAQLASVLKRVRGQTVICGDFNSSLVCGSALSAQLVEGNFRRAPTEGITWARKYAGHCCAGELDHIWATPALVPSKILCSSSEVCAVVRSTGLPDLKNPSDHLPIAVAFRLEPLALCEQKCHTLSLVEPPSSPCNEIQQEWLEILRLATVGASKKVARDQKRLEKAFLKTLSNEEASNLRNWQLAATASAKLIVSAATARAASAVQTGIATSVPGLNIASSGLSEKKTHDPGGEPCTNSTLQDKLLHISSSMLHLGGA
jgi:endonuclease/exonuclease/phosphatase family metal-dependent hydrolase